MFSMASLADALSGRIARELFDSEVSLFDLQDRMGKVLYIERNQHTYFVPYEALLARGNRDEIFGYFMDIGQSIRLFERGDVVFA